ncbi:MAG: glycoside hydrolase family 5 protein, partial [Clostridia bacterium]|nr:glycoside hydrolase family 5 protein [Clostridia bacterium]
MRRMILFSFLFALALLWPLFSSASAEAPANAVEMTRLMGNGINLGNTMEACNNGVSGGSITSVTSYYETMWGQPVTTAEMIRAMKDAGFDTLRIPVAWMTNATRLNKGDYTISPAYLERVEQIVNYALDAGMYVIVNDHWDGGWWGMFGSDTAETREFAMQAYTGMWQQIAEHFADYDYRLIFESANEELGARFDENSPLYCQDSITHTMPDAERFQLTNKVNQVFVDTVRAAGGRNADRFLLIAGYGTDINMTCDSRFHMPEDTVPGKLMVSVHYYNPWSYCGSNSAKGATLWGKKKDFEEMYSLLSRLKMFTSAGYGVVIGEYGALPAGDGYKANAPAYHKAFLDCCDALDLTSCLWDCSGYFLRANLSMGDEEMAAVYAGRNAVSEAGKDYADIAAAGKAALDSTIEAAPESLISTDFTLTDDTCVAWIMFSEGNWSLSYSVGDIYTPDSISPGIKATDAEITGPGTYTVALDFTGTEKGYAENTAFSAIGISNGETLHPDWCIMITGLKLNGEPMNLKGRNYT